MSVPAASEIDAIFATGKNGTGSVSIPGSKAAASASASTSTSKVKTSKVNTSPPEDSKEQTKRKKSKKKRKHAESEADPTSAVDGDEEWLGFSADAAAPKPSSSQIDSVTSVESPAAPADGDEQKKKKKKRNLLTGTELENEPQPTHQQEAGKRKDSSVRTAHVPVVTIVDTSSTLPSAVSGKAGTRKTPVSRLAKDGGVSEPKVSVNVNGKRKDEDDSRFRDSRGTGPRRHTEDGYAIYKEDELGIGDQGGDTPLCPFDCDCCF